MNFSMRVFTLSCIGLVGCYTTHARRLGERGLQNSCPQIGKNTNFTAESLNSYVSSEWYVHEQEVTAYLPVENNYCVTANYNILPSSTFWGYTIEVNNKAKNLNGEDFGGILYAAQTNPSDDPAKLEVAPGFLPRTFAGPYWILEYEQETSGEEWALIVGGQPNERTADGCKTKNRIITSSGGLWIFTRSPERNGDLIKKIKDIAEDKYELDTIVLNPVNHTAIDCGYV